MKFRLLIGYSVITTMVLNLNVALIGLAISAFTLAPVPAFAMLGSDTPKKDEMNAKYNLSNPTRNHQSDTFDPKLEAYFNQPARDLNPTLGQVLSTPVPTRTIDLSGYNLNRNMSEQLDMAKNLSKTHGTPVKNAGDYKSEYTKTGTRQFTRDANGQLVMGVVEGVPKVQNFNDDDMLGAEAQNPNYSSEKNKESMYGDDTKIFAEGKAIHTNFKDANSGKSASGRAYRVITGSAQRGIDTNIPESSPWLKPSFNAVADAQDPTKMFGSCSEVKKPVIEKVAVTKKTEHKCQDTSQVNKDFCEVTRAIKIPVFSNSAGLKSCGPGCYEFPLNVDAWKTSKCRSSPGDSPSAKFVLNLNMSQGFTIKSVKINGTADDHFRYTMNGQKIWESNGGSQSTNGNMDAGSCNPDGYHVINTDVTNTVNSILGPLPSTGVVTLNFQGDIRWKQNGGMASTVRIELEDTSGQGFETKFIQYPEGCYDALKMEDKLTRGLDGVYNWKELGIDPSLPPISYQCTSSPRQPVCPAGEVAFGSAGQEKCYASPIPPVCPSGTYNTLTGQCEYAATKTCPSVAGMACGVDGQGNPMFAISPSATLNVDTCTYTDHEHCGAWSHVASANSSCPNGGSLVGQMCVSQANKTNSCDASKGYSLKKVKINGVEQERCEGPVTSYQPNSWSCDGGESFSTSYCAVTYEDFRDENGSLIPTIDANGFPINPPFLDNEGQPIQFMDVAKCLKPQPLPNQPLPDIPKSFCTFDEYQNIDVGDNGFTAGLLAAIPPFYSGDSGNKTWKVNLKGYRCDPTNGQLMCRIDDISGEKVCTTWEELRQKPDQCEAYKKDPTCVEVSSTCPDGWYEPVSKRCMSETKRYECSTTSTIDVKNEVTTNTCAGMLPCLGGDCEVGEKETNPNFVKAMVAASVIDEAQDDSQCEDPADATTCRIFNGKFKYCSWETTGMGMDCCEEAKGVDIVGYVVFSRQMLKVGKMAGSGAYGQGVQGMYKTLSTPITNATEAISSWANTAVNEVGTYVQGAYSSTVNSLMGSTEVVSSAGNATASLASAGAGEGLTATMKTTLYALQQEVYAFVYNMLPESMANLIFTTSTSTVGAQTTTTYTANGPLVNAMSNVLAVYAAYQMIKLALTLLTACDDVEMDMGVKLAQRTCFKVGDSYCNKRYPVIGGLGACMQNRQNYCCYSSILSRIVMKESYSQLGINPLPYGNQPSSGPQMDGSCQGLTFEQFGQVNFEAPSMQTALQEWVGLLLESQQIPTETSEQSLTGGASTSDPSCPLVEKPILDCYTDAVTLKEVCQQKRDANGNVMYDLVQQECIKKLGPGQIWNAKGRKITSERTKDNIGNAQDRVQESKDKMREAANTLDCSVYPRPPVCEMNIDPRDD